MTKNKPPTESIGRAASRSVFWNMTGSFGISAIRFVATAILARLLMPDDFGIIGMAFLVTKMIQLFGDLGLGAALIHKEEIDEEYLSTAYWSSVGAGFVLMLAGCAASPLAAFFFQQGVVGPVVICLSTTFLIGSLSSVQYMLLSKELRYKEIAVIEISTTVVRVVIALTLASLGFTFWSIIIAIIGERTLKTVVFFLHSRWRPRFLFVTTKFRELFTYGRHLYGSGFLIYLNSNMDYIVTGRLLGAAQLGYYQFAFNIPHLVQTHFAAKIHQVLFPVYAKIQNENDRIARGIGKTLKLTALVTLPLMGGLMITASEFILTVYGEKWTPSIAPLRVLCLAAAMKSLMMTNAALFLAKGRPDISFKWALALLPVTILAVITGSRWGQMGVATAMTLVSLLGLIQTRIAFGLIDEKLALFFKSIREPLLNTLMMAAFLLTLRQLTPLPTLPDWQSLLIHMAAGLLFYALTLRLFFKEALDLLIEIYNHLAKKKAATT